MYVPQSKKKKSRCISSAVRESKEMDERRANSAFRQEVHRGRGFAFIGTHCLHRAEIGERYWRAKRNEQATANPRERGVITGTQKAVISASNQSRIANKHKQPGQIAALITGPIVARWDLYWRLSQKERKKRKGRRMSSHMNVFMWRVDKTLEDFPGEELTNAQSEKNISI